MSKMNITVGKGANAVTATKAKAEMRDRIQEIIIAALTAEFGEDAAGMVRITSEATGRGENLIGAIVADIGEDGGVFDGGVTIKVTCKEWTDRIGTKSVKPAWDFQSARDEYESWLCESERIAAEKASAKAAKAAADAAARAKRKAEADARKANKP